ncbi:WecB/TagA/CpsF family glycosyltransferase [Sinorhizobium garamanticum]|uniref:WecB/TagA/CpsF family glycosyltransferase n=1 Tax=Sinorhizobium garamanticum TaxID=680247 RepID=A0ABY8DDG1_9HYPH|nr:WecB/TagA/CpsF family glycosyltransferase [Sinorhizobium garamanticum]WEX88088.1 WecB/TagA/CpsF family glycosyltransferase [Sinorhizobium garamanticum]
MNVVSRIAVAASKRITSSAPPREFGWADALAFADTVVSRPKWHAIVTDRMFPSSRDAMAFVPALLTYIEKPMRVALVGSHRHVAEHAAENFRSHAPWHQFIAVGGFSDQANALDKVRALQPDILLVKIQSLKQEKWVDRYIAPEHGRLVITVCDFVTQGSSRAPVLLRWLEWLYRFVAEAGRRRTYHAFRWRPMERDRDLANASGPPNHFDPRAYRGARLISHE